MSNSIQVGQTYEFHRQTSGLITVLPPDGTVVKVIKQSDWTPDDEHTMYEVRPVAPEYQMTASFPAFDDELLTPETKTLYALRFVNSPDAGTRHFDTMTEALLYGAQSGFEFTVAPVTRKEFAK